MTLYLYAIVDRQPRDRARLGRGIARQSLSLVRAGSAFVVVEPAEPREATPRALVAHDRVVRRIARLVPSVLPLRFGTGAPDRAALEALIAPLAGSIAPAFERVRDAVQFTIRVSGRRSPPSIPARVGPGTRWIAERIARQQVPEVAAISEAPRPWVRDARAERHDRGRGGKGSAPRDRPHFASVYHLVARADVRAWRRALGLALEELPKGVSITTTGPWPPWAFAELA